MQHSQIQLESEVQRQSCVAEARRQADKSTIILHAALECTDVTARRQSLVLDRCQIHREPTKYWRTVILNLAVFGYKSRPISSMLQTSHHQPLQVLLIRFPIHIFPSISYYTEKS